MEPPPLHKEHKEHKEQNYDFTPIAVSASWLEVGGFMLSLGSSRGGLGWG